jgi:hypothetical protein
LAQPFTTATNKVLEESSRGNVSSLPIFDASFILTATDNFALSNKLGEGGFGTVYRVILHLILFFSLINYALFSLYCLQVCMKCKLYIYRCIIAMVSCYFGQGAVSTIVPHGSQLVVMRNVTN